MSHRTIGFGCAAIAIVGFALFRPLSAAPMPATGLSIDTLRCEYLVDPLGIDIVQPRLSWELRGSERGQKQTAFQILVATSPEQLAADQGDLWDSGRTESDQSAQIEYAGKSLASQMRCTWKVRVWDKDGKPSAWSKPAYWSMGLLQKSDWQAEWIAAPELAHHEKLLPNEGFHSYIARSADTPKWVTIDLGSQMAIDAVRLYPLYRGEFFPVRFKIEASDEPAFKHPRSLVDRTDSDVPNPSPARIEFGFPSSTARYIRLTATRLASVAPGSPLYSLGLAEMEVLGGGKILSGGATVTATDSIESEAWSKANLVDGRRVATGAVRRQPAQPVTMLRKEFAIRQKIRRATVFATARGLYELSINGRRVGDQLLAPGWTEYNVRIPYQTYDVTDLLREGDNAIGAMLGVGWYAGPIGAIAPRGRELYGPFCQLMLHLEIENADGSHQVIASDGTWQSSIDGPIRFAEIYDGEIQDASKEMPGWNKPGYSANVWRPADVAPLDNVKLVAQRCDPIRAVQEIAPVAMSEPKPGVYLFDMGQNMVGWCRLKVRGAADAFVVVRHAERLDSAGSGLIDVVNLHSAKATDTYTTKTAGEETFEPHFTYHGFRYVQITGLPTRPLPGDLTGRVIHTDAPLVSKFETSNALANSVMRCIDWTQWGNMMSIPTDCPQRSERLGWMGDIQAFSQASTYNMDMAAFFTKWSQDIRDSQFDNGAFTALSPHFHTGLRNKPIHVAPGGVYGEFAAAPAWSDAGVIIPWRVYENYGDKRLLAEHFEAARRWIDYIDRNNPDTHLFVVGRGEQYNDWLGGYIPTDEFSTAFYAHSTELVAKMARVLGRQDDAQHYTELFQNIKAAYRKAFVKPDGTVEGNSQSAYVFALRFNLIDEAQRPAAIDRILADIKLRKGHFATGIQATHRLMLELSRDGHHDAACDLFNLRTTPSWGFMIDSGATTIWEAWSLGAGTSANHFAHASIGQWLWQDIVGIAPDDSQPGYKHFFLAPRPGPGFTWAKGTFHSIHGPITSDWKIEKDRFQYDCEIPANTSATVFIPTNASASVTESGAPADKAIGVKFLRSDGGAAVYEVQSGSYHFDAPR